MPAAIGDQVVRSHLDTLIMRIHVLGFFVLGVAGVHAHGAIATIYNLQTLGGNESFAYSINASSQITGYSLKGGSGHAYRYSGTPGVDGVMTDLGTLGGNSSQGNAINAAGQIV